MAYFFQGLVRDINNIEHWIDIYRYGIEPNDPLYEIEFSDPDAIILTHKGGSKDEWDDSIIQGIELQYSFFVPIKDAWVVDELMESPYGYYYLSHWISGGEVELFRGLLKPENMTADFLGNPEYIAITVIASDALGDLKQSEFRNLNGTVVKGLKTLLQVIQLAVNSIKNLAVDCKVYLNTYETTLMTYDECPLEKIYVRCERFYEENDKGVDVMSCYDVIEAILKPFNCKLFQYAGGLFIINYYEMWGGTIYSYLGNPWTLQNSYPYISIVDIEEYLFKPNIERQKIHPLKQIKTIFKNRDIGGDVVSLDLLDPDNWTHTFTGISNTEEGYIQLLSVHNPGYAPEKLELVNSFTITAPPEGIYILRIEIEYRIIDYVGPSDCEKQIEVQIKRPGNSDYSSTLVYLPLTSGGLWRKADTGQYSTMKLYDSGNYNIRLIFSPIFVEYDWESFNLQIRSVSITRQLYGEEKDYDPKKISLDQDYIQVNDTGIEKKETQILIGDGFQITEVGTLRNSNELLTSGWARSGWNENIKLVDVFTRNILANRSCYKNFLRLTIIDRENTLNVLNTVWIKGVMYAFSSYTKNIRLGEIEAELVQIVYESGVSY